MLGFNVLFYVSLPSRPNISNTLCNVVDREIFSMFTTDH